MCDEAVEVNNHVLPVRPPKPQGRISCKRTIMSSGNPLSSLGSTVISKVVLLLVLLQTQRLIEANDESLAVTTSHDPESILNPRIFIVRNFNPYPLNESYGTCKPSDFGSCNGGVDGLIEFLKGVSEPYVLTMGGHFANSVLQLDKLYSYFSRKDAPTVDRQQLVHVIGKDDKMSGEAVALACQHFRASIIDSSNVEVRMENWMCNVPPLEYIQMRTKNLWLEITLNNATQKEFEVRNVPSNMKKMKIVYNDTSVEVKVSPDFKHVVSSQGK
jgi:hypothetical protein